MNIQNGYRLPPDSLIEMSNRYGGDARYVLAGGGNSSWKDDDVMYVKSSGVSLATIKAGGFSVMDRRRLSEIMNRQYDGGDDAKREAAVLSDMMNARLPGGESLRPSVETLLHNLFQYSYVLHLHPALVNGMTCGMGGEHAARELFGESFIWIPEYKPGYELAKLCRLMIDEYTNRFAEATKLIFLQNHGVFAAANSVEEIDAIYADITAKLGRRAVIKPAAFYLAGGSAADSAVAGGEAGGGTVSCNTAGGEADGGAVVGGGTAGGSAAGGSAAGGGATYDGAAGGIEALTEAIKSLPSRPSEILYVNSSDIERFLDSRENFTPLSGAFTPDHIVYCKAKFMYLDGGFSPATADGFSPATADGFSPATADCGSPASACVRALSGRYADFVSQHGYEPRVICARGVGAFICANTSTEAANARALFMDAVSIAVYCTNFGGPRHLSPKLTDFIVNWEIESYRSKVAQQDYM